MTNPAAPPVYGWRVRFVVLLLVPMLPAAFIVLFLYNPAEHGFFPKCWYYQLTNTHCPGCGSTRAVHALLHGHVLQAAAYNFPIFILLPLIFYHGSSIALSILRNRPIELGKTSTWFLRGLLLFVLAYWILRNIPLYPFTLLAPHELGTVAP